LPKAPQKRLSVLWTKNLRDSDDKEEFQRTILSSVTALRRLKELLEDYESEVRNKELSEADFANIDWAYKQAFRNGQRSAYTKIKELLDWIDT